MKYFIIIRGPLGIGKTTIAKNLAKKLNGYYVSIDKILEKNKLDKVKGKSIPLKNFIKATEIEIPSIKKKLTTKPIIFDGNFYHKQQIRHMIRKLNAPHHIFTLKAPIELCVKRDSGRKKAYGKAATYQVYKLVSKFDSGKSIDVKNKTVNSIVKEIISSIK
ncbi:MAG: AAA family ATPase [Candidatus Aenigmatarchaeota archaeon]